VRPSRLRSVNATCPSSGSAGWQQVKDQLQPVVPGRHHARARATRTGTTRTGAAHETVALACDMRHGRHLKQLGRLGRGPPQPVERPIAGRRGQPRAGVAGHPVVRHRSSARVSASCAHSFTVSVAAELVTVPAVLVTTTRNVDPLSEVRRCRCRVTRGSRSRDVHGILLPLVTDRSCSCGHDCKRWPSVRLLLSGLLALW